MRLGQLLLDLIYPEKDRCMQCGTVLSFPEIPGLCYDCLSAITYIDDETNYYHNESSLSSYKRCYSVGSYDGLLRELILTFKYLGEKDLANPLGSLMALYYELYFSQLQIDYLLPIPLHKKRKQQRGFNQARLLAEVIAEKWGLPILSNFLLRGRETPPLYELKLQQRKEIMNNAFIINQDFNDKLNKNKEKITVLLIDDILTTGTTLQEAGQILKSNPNINEIYAYTLAAADIV